MHIGPLLALGLLAALLLAGCLTKPAATLDEPAMAPELHDDNTSIEDLSASSDMLTDDEGQLPVPHPCAGLTSEADRDNCYIYEATAKQDKSVCDKINDSGQFYACMYNVALQTDDIGICTSITVEGPREICQMNLAVAADGDYNGTDDIAPRAREICDQLPDVWKTNCYKRIALAQQ